MGGHLNEALRMMQIPVPIEEKAKRILREVSKRRWSSLFARRTRCTPSLLKESALFDEAIDNAPAYCW